MPSTASPRHAYVHVPFCARRCAYCDFAIAVRRVVPVEDYVEGLSRELALRYPGDDRELETLYFGGGTPSRLGGAGVAAAIDAARRHARLAPGAEVTIEANPEDVTAANVAEWAAAGVSRLSLGSQSFDDRVLAWMHRTHDAGQIGRAVEAARRGGIENLSLDLIFALPEALGRDWARDLDAALALEPDHLSLYGLTVEAHTPLARWRERGEVHDAPEERYEAEFLLAHERMTAAGFDHYEVSSFGRPGRHSRHNSSYWTGVPYAGLGPAAHEYDGVARRWNLASYPRWLDALREGLDPVEAREVLSEENRAAETVYLGLRTTHGLALEPEELAMAELWVAEGWGELTGAVLRLSPLGWLRLDALAASLTARRSR